MIFLEYFGWRPEVVDEYTDEQLHLLLKAKVNFTNERVKEQRSQTAHLFPRLRNKYRGHEVRVKHIDIEEWLDKGGQTRFGN